MDDERFINPQVGPQIVPQKVVQLPGTKPAPEIDTLNDLHRLSEKAMEMTESTSAHNAAMLKSMQEQQAAIQEQLDLTRRCTIAAEKQADALVRIADWFEGA